MAFNSSPEGKNKVYNLFVAYRLVKSHNYSVFELVNPVLQSSSCIHSMQILDAHLLMYILAHGGFTQPGITLNLSPKKKNNLQVLMYVQGATTLSTTIEYIHLLAATAQTQSSALCSHRK